MPTYQYTCTDCGEPVEALQKFTDAPLVVCAACGGRLRKVFSPVGIVFKGSGFYRTDSRNGSGPSAAAKDKPSGDSGAAASDKPGGSGTADKPAGSGTADKPAASRSGKTGSASSRSSSSGEKVA